MKEPHKMHRIPWQLLAAALTLILLSGCASVSVRKIDSEGEASGPDGVRFYRPRPYVSVYEPFVIASRAYVAGGRLTPDGRFIVLTDIPDELAGRVTLHHEEAAVRSSEVVVAPEGAVEGKVQSGEPAAVAAVTAPEPNCTEENGPVKTGQLNLRVTNDNTAYAVQPGRKYFDIVFLPDFDEDYVVSAESRLGNASADITLGQGWSLQAMAMKVDNDELNKRIFALMDESQKILTAAARTALGMPAIVGGPQAGEVTSAERAFAGGTPVSVKVTLVRVVAPGLYKILKPKELEAFNPEAAAGIDPGWSERILVPVAPLTNIAFNTYEVMVFEAAPLAGDSPLRLNQTIDVSMRTGGGGAIQPPVVDPTKMQAEVDGAIIGLNVAAKVKISIKESTLSYEIVPNAGTDLSAADKGKIQNAVTDVAAQHGLAAKDITP